ncbi:hypothetical protein ACF0H5_021100 [Mactra antiquata]
MLLSSVNFVAKPKATKSKDGKVDKKATKKTEPVKQKEEKVEVCEECIKELEEEKTIFRFPSSTSQSCSSKSSGYASTDGQDFANFPGDRVTIATSDDLCLTVDQFFYTIGLRDESKSDSTCIFRKKVLETKTLSNGQMETVVFALDCDQEFYITTSKTASLELNYCARTPTLDEPDERHFVVHHTSLGHSFIQPKLHKNMYLHHIDESLSVQQLDLNWRCPEEYFFHFSAVPEVVTRRNTEKPKVCTHKKVEPEENTSKINKTETCVKTVDKKCKTDLYEKIPAVCQVKLPSQKKFRGEKLISNLFFGCFSGRGRHIGTEV